MQLSESRTSVLLHTADWTATTATTATRAHMGDRAVAASAAGPPSSLPPSVPASQRRRSAVLRPPPPSAPPPSLPIPDLPVIDTPDGLRGAPPAMDDFDYANGALSPSSYFARPAASPGLAAVAAFSQTQARQLSNLQPSPPSPPRLRPHLEASSSAPAPVVNAGHDIVPDRLLLSPSDPSTRNGGETRPSSRRALTKALELAREAVKLDSTNDDPYGAILAYGKSVALLSKVMERVMREDPNDQRRKGGRRRSVVAQEEEVRRLKAIHDTYADRMNILSLIYDIPAQPQSPTSLYPSTSVSTSNSAVSTRPSSPSSSHSPTSDAAPPLPHHSRHPEEADLDDRRFSQETARYDGAEMFSNGYSVDQRPSLPYPHPFATSSQSSVNDDLIVVDAPLVQPAPPPPASSTSPRSAVPSRPSVRPRAISVLPPPAPPPQNALPPAPDHAHAQPPLHHLHHHPPPTQQQQPQQPQQHLTIVPPTRPRGTSTSSHIRNLSGSKLESLKEHEESPLHTAHQPYFDRSTLEPNSVVRPRTSDVPFTPRDPNRDSHPLPPLPLPPTSPKSERSSSDMPTPRTQPISLDNASPRSELPETPLSHLINSSTAMGTISMRRGKMSAPPSTNSSPRIPDAAPPAALRMPPNTAGLPPSSGQPRFGRSRSTSQPGHPPTFAMTPPLTAQGDIRPTSSMLGSRKASVTSAPKTVLPYNSQVQAANGTLSPPPTAPALSLVTQLVPPPPIPHGNLPTTPISPMPPMPPSDAMRKPYHMMGLLRHTMTSRSGGYITRRLHVPQEVWSQGGAKLQDVPEKVRVVEELCAALEDVHRTVGEVFGPGNVSTGTTIGSITKKEADAWTARLEEFSAVCDSVVANFGKRLGVGEGFMTKKNAVATWSGKFTRQFKLTNQKNLDSPATYVQALGRLFEAAQLLDEHSQAITTQPAVRAYASLPIESRQGIESRLRRASEFFASVVLTFVVRDLALLLDKYVKTCEKWLAT